MKSLKKISLNKVSNFAFVALIIAFLVVGLVRTVCFPKDINGYENRYCEKVIMPSWDTFFNGTFQKSMEDALADQIPKAQTLKKAYNIVNGEYLKMMMDPFIQANSDSYISYKGVRLFGGYIAYSPRNLEEEKPALHNKAENYNAIIKAHPELEFYAYYIEKDTDVSFDTCEQIGMAEYILSLLDIDDEKKAIYEVNNFADFEGNFYKTDHHWNHKGSYKAYLHIMDLLKCQDERIQCGAEQLILDGFLGSKASMTGLRLFQEAFYGYKYELPELKITENGVVKDNYGHQESYLAAQSVKEISYADYYGLDSGELILDSGKEDRENILIIGDSYDNAILKLMATHYNKIFSIDLRNYEAQNGKTFAFDEYVEENNISKVVFIGNIGFYTSKDFLLENE